MAEERLQLSKALTKRKRLFGVTSGKYEGNMVRKLESKNIQLNDDKLGVIRKKIFSFEPIVFTVGKDAPRGFKTVQEFENDVKSNRASIEQHLKNGFELYEKILAANAEKKISVGDKQMSVAAAVVYRDQVIPMLEGLRDSLQQQLQTITLRAEANDVAVREKAELWLQNELTSDNKTDSERINRMRNDYLEGKLSKIHDPLGLSKLIEELTTRIEQESDDIQTGLYNNNVSTEITWTPAE
jgi:hypothetical protein